ncbi:hypothetical protein, partial [Bordetella pseudohinzii]|uniref:hypothetical protein n=1 Tax=Bordetella pseudohinzii TaxID=1331258 RepID=UPI001E629BFE
MESHLRENSRALPGHAGRGRKAEAARRAWLGVWGKMGMGGRPPVEWRRAAGAAGGEKRVKRTARPSGSGLTAAGADA